MITLNYDNITRKKLIGNRIHFLTTFYPQKQQKAPFINNLKRDEVLTETGWRPTIYGSY